MFLVIAFPIAMFATSPSIEYSIDKNEEDYHLAHLNLILGAVSGDITSNITDSITDTLGYPPERILTRLITMTKMQHNNAWYSVNTISINPNESLEVNQIKIEEGKFFLERGEIAMLDSFATYLQVALEDSITLNLGEVSKTFKIVGFVKAVDYLSYDLIQEGVVYLNELDIRDMMEIPKGTYNNVLIYFSKNITVDDIKESAEELHNYFIDHHIPIYLMWHSRTFSYSEALSDSLNLTSSYLFTSAILIIIVVGIVIFIITKRYAVEQRKQTGVLYSYGFSSKIIMAAFILRTLILSLFAIVIGTISGWYLLNFLTMFFGNLWGLIEVSSVLTLEIILEVTLTTFFISLFFTYLAAKENVSLTPYEAIRGKPKEYSRKRKFNKVLNLPLSIKISFRSISRNKMRSILTTLAFCFSIMLSFSLISTKSNLNSTQNEYFETINWDIQAEFNTEDYSDKIYMSIKNSDVIENSEPYFQLNVQFYEESDQITNLRGILSNGTLMKIDLQEGEGFSDDIKNEIIISQYSAKRLGYSVGNNCSFWLFNARINVTIVGISRTMDFPIASYIKLETLESYWGYMPINAMMVDVQDSKIEEFINELNENSNVSFAIKKSMFERNSKQVISSQTVILDIMVVLSLVVSFLSIFSTTLIIILERNREYTLQRVFGFSTKQVLIQIFNEIILLALIALAIGYILGNFLSLFWSMLITENFFSVDSFPNLGNYLLLFVFAIGSCAFSLYPEYRSLRKGSLAEGIREE